jgi:hypothetical protein
MQAMRDFSELNDEWLLDFLPDDTGVDQPRGVLAAAIGPELVDQLNRTCANAVVVKRDYIDAGPASPSRPAFLSALVPSALGGSPPGGHAFFGMKPFALFRSGSACLNCSHAASP